MVVTLLWWCGTGVVSALVLWSCHICGFNRQARWPSIGINTSRLGVKTRPTALGTVNVS